MRYDASNAECLVFTYKEGLLSRVGHDLKFAVRSFEVDFDPTERVLVATFDPRTVDCVTAMKKGRENPKALSAKDMRQIRDNMEREVLQPAKYPTIRYEASEIVPEAGGFRVRGTLELAGRSRPVSALARPRGGDLVAEVRLHQPDFGIEPCSALMGTLRIQPTVLVRLTIPAA